MGFNCFLSYILWQTFLSSYYKKGKRGLNYYLVIVQAVPFAWKRYEVSTYKKKESALFHVLVLSSRMSCSHSVRYPGLAIVISQKLRQLALSTSIQCFGTFGSRMLIRFFKKQDFYGWRKAFNPSKPFTQHKTEPGA